MNINIAQQTISKPKGKRTPAATVTFNQLSYYIGIWKLVVGPMLASTRNSISQWRNAGQPASQVRNVLNAIIITFGAGHRVWPKVDKFLKKANGSNTANKAVVTVDGNATKLSAINIISLFAQLKTIKGLGSKESFQMISGCSYASKVLRCLSDKHVVLDDLIEDELDEWFYLGFRKKCEDIGKAMSPTQLPAEVEGGLYAWLQLINPHQSQRCWRQHQKNVQKTISSKAPPSSDTPRCEG